MKEQTQKTHSITPALHVVSEAIRTLLRDEFEKPDVHEETRLLFGYSIRVVHQLDVVYTELLNTKADVHALVSEVKAHQANAKKLTEKIKALEAQVEEEKAKAKTEKARRTGRGTRRAKRDSTAVEQRRARAAR